jgi:hypothetical protein
MVRRSRNFTDARDGRGISAASATITCNRGKFFRAATAAAGTSSPRRRWGFPNSSSAAHVTTDLRIGSSRRSCGGLCQSQIALRGSCCSFRVAHFTLVKGAHAFQLLL